MLSVQILLLAKREVVLPLEIKMHPLSSSRPATSLQRPGACRCTRNTADTWLVTARRLYGEISCRGKREDVSLHVGVCASHVDVSGGVIGMFAIITAVENGTATCTLSRGGAGKCRHAARRGASPP